MDILAEMTVLSERLGKTVDESVELSQELILRQFVSHLIVMGYPLSIQTEMEWYIKRVVKGEPDAS